MFPRVWPAALLLTVALAGCGSGPTEEPTMGGAFGGDVEAHEEDAEGGAIQNGTGAVVGVVRNVNGAAVWGAHVVLLGQPFSQETDRRGAFGFDDVPVGDHTVRVDQRGYLSLERTIAVNVGKVVRLNVTLADNAPGGPGFREHLHDRWGGQTRITLFEETVRHTHEYAPSGTNFLPCTRGGGFTVSSANCYDIPLPLEEDTIVPPGTVRIEVTVDWEKTDYVPTVQLLYEDANGTRGESEPIAPGKTASVPVRAPMSDHGHQRFSLWSFTLHAEPSVAGVSFSSQYLNEQVAGEFEVRLVAHKGSLPTEAPHPRYWRDGDTLVLIDGVTHDLVGLPRTRIPSQTTCNDNEECFTLPAGTLVPPGTTTLHVTLEYKPDTEAAEPYLSRKTLAFRTSDVRPQDATLGDLRVEGPVEIEAGRTVYELALEKEEVDAFYQKKSLWLFLLANEGEERGERFVEDCVHYVGGCGGSHYTLTVTAVNDAWTPELAGRET